MINSQSVDSAMAKTDSRGRISFIDGFRGIAILLVVAYHYFSLWGPENRDLYPFGGILVEFPLFKYGFYGVPLFFVVSGFVIAMTLERTSGWLEFVVRRFARLWPPMLLCSILTFLVLSLWPDLWPQTLRNFIPSLTFMDGEVVWGKIWPGLGAQYIEGAYWTLFVEVRFYFYAGLIYFCSPRHFSRNFAGFVVALVTVYCVCRMTGTYRIAGIAHDAFVAPYLPWFMGGLAAYEWSRGRKQLGLALATISGACMVWLGAVDAPDANILVALIVALLFAACFSSDVIRRVFSASWLSAIGLSSYSLYLLHQRIGITVIAKVSAWTGWTGPSSVIIAIFMLLLMIGLSRWIYRYWEHPWNRAIVRWYHIVRERTSPRLMREQTP